MDLRLTDVMRQRGTFDLSTVVLAVDGHNVTRKARVLGTTDYPQSRAVISYTPAAPLSLGRHRASLTFPSMTRRVTIAWAFVVADIPCP